MTRRHLIAAFVVWHLTAIVLGALPPPDQLKYLSVPRQPSHLGPTFDRLTAAFDDFGRVVEVVPRALWWVSTPVRPLADWYLSLAGLAQSWAMFSNPPQWDEYVRTRYYIRPPSGRVWAATELVMPAHRENEIRLVRSYWDSYRDKDMAIAQANFFRRRKPALIRPDTRPDELPNDLAPIGRYFARAFASRALAGTGDRIVRIEVWLGKAPSPAPGESVNRALLAQRMEVLQSYYEGPIEHRFNVPPYPPYHGGETEADIHWLLEYYEEP